MGRICLAGVADEHSETSQFVTEVLPGHSRAHRKRLPKRRIIADLRRNCPTEVSLNSIQAAEPASAKSPTASGLLRGPSQRRIESIRITTAANMMIVVRTLLI